MQYVNDDMDELIRRAAKDYPLNTEGADWSKVLNALESDGGASPPTNKSNGGNRYLWLLLLLPIGLVCNHFVSNNRNQKEPAAGAQAIPVQPGNDAALKFNKQGAGVSATERTGERNRQQQYVNPDQNTDKKEILYDPGYTLYTKNIRQDKDVKNGSSSSRYAYHRSSFQSSPIIRVTIIPPQIRTKEGYVSTVHPAGDKSGPPFPTQKSVTNKNFTSAESLPDSLGKDINADHVNVLKSGADNSMTGGQPLPYVSDTAATSVLVNPVKQYRKKFYAGAFATIDATTIKLQKIQQGSVGYGALLGYSFSNRWSVEASASTVKRYYYSKGKYLKTTHIYMPPNSSITELDGDCRMTDISVAARYSFGRSRAWFGAAGLSSYQMKSEHYDYVYYYPTSGSYVTRTRSYYETRDYLAAAIQLSAGYYFPLGKTGMLRIEPYVKVPLKEMGIGSLPLTSGGVQFGLVRRIF